MKIYAMSDIHGCLAEFNDALALVDLSGENILILLGDYIHGPDSYGVLNKIISLQRRYGTDKVVALMGNHEEWAVNGMWGICDDDESDGMDDQYFVWLSELPRYYATEHQIFCHAGVNEDAGELWEEETDDYTYIEKSPAQTGHFYLDIIAGHTATSEISANPHFHDIYFDGESHYYIDGTVLDSGEIPVLMYDTETEIYYRVTDIGEFPVEAYDEDY